MVISDYFKHYFSVDLLTLGSVIETLTEMGVMRNFIVNIPASPCIIEEQTSSIIKVNR